jgi:hypothetical protein
VSLYFKRLLTLAQTAKMQLNRYVNKKAAVESLVLDWSAERYKLAD